MARLQRSFTSAFLVFLRFVVSHDVDPKIAKKYVAEQIGGEEQETEIVPAPEARFAAHVKEYGEVQMQSLDLEERLDTEEMREKFEAEEEDDE